MKALLILSVLAVAGCASSGSTANDPAVDLADAQVAVRTETNGDVIEEYRVAGQLRMVKVTPSRGPAYYLMDTDGNGKLNRDDRDPRVSPVHWTIYEWD